MDAFFLELFRGANTLPSTCDLNQNPLAFDALALVKLNQPSRSLNRARRVEAKRRIHLGGHAARNDLQDLLSEADKKPIHECAALSILVAAFALCNVRRSV